MSYIGNPIVSTDFPKDTFSGNGSTTAFTMSIAPASVNAVIVAVSGVVQDPSTYTISGTTLTFSGAPPSGTSNISVRHLGVAGIPNTPSAASVTDSKLALTTPALGTPSSINLANATGLTGAQGGSMVLIGSATASNSATIDFTSINPSSYSSYRIVIDCAVPANNAANLLLRTSSSGTFQTSGYYWQNWRWTTSGQGVAGQWGTATGIALDAAGADNISNSANNGGSWIVDFYVPSQASDIHRCNYQGYYLGSANLGIVGNGWSGTNTIDGFRLLMDNGNISTGRFYLYGIKNA